MSRLIYSQHRGDSKKVINMSEPQIFWPQEMREDQLDRREFSHWLEAVQDIDAQKKRNIKQKEQANEQGQE